MTPADYLRHIVLPTLAEFMAAPDDQRRAYLACITAAHLADHVARFTKASPKEVRQAIGRPGDYSTRCVEIVEGVSNGTKHAGASREAKFPFVPGYERRAPAFAWDVPEAGWDVGRWNGPGLIVAHRIVGEADGLGSYFIDDCVRGAVRAYAETYPTLFASVDLSVVALDHDRWAALIQPSMSAEGP